ncbi:hypothetical protein [Chitinophaga defluvii]|uniref:DUF4468 domain-containing protein n=1 Tax=Chitinophaga defluvii TaxID=3163343 RepID=A0ABV2TDA9_9BACT
MKLIPKVLAGLALMALVLPASAQRIKLTDGSLAELKGETKINTEFTYDHMKVGKFDSEEEYIQKKTAEYNKKEPGKGDTWAKAWVSDRAGRFEPKFNQLFTDNSGGITAGNEPAAKYTLIFKTAFTEPGFNVGVWRQNAEMDGEAWIVETANKEKVVAKLSVNDAKGRLMGFDFDTGLRIQEAYADAAKALAKYIRKQL